MNKTKIIFFCFLFFQQNINYAKKYILKSENIYQKENEDEDFILKNSNFSYSAFVKDKIFNFINNSYVNNFTLKKINYYNNLVTLLGKFYLEKIKTCSDNREKLKFIKEYQTKLNKIKKNRKDNFFLKYVKQDENFFEIDEYKQKLKNKLDKKGFFDAEIKIRTNIDGNFIFVDTYLKKKKGTL